MASKMVLRTIETTHGRIEECLVRCGKKSCWCASEEGRTDRGTFGHGPYYYEVRSFKDRAGTRKEVRQYIGTKIDQMKPWRKRRGMRKEEQ